MKQNATTFKSKVTLLVLTCMLLLSPALAWSQVVAWQFGDPASAGNEDTYTATTNDPNLEISTLSRSGVWAMTLPNGFSSDHWNTSSPTLAEAISLGEYYEFTIQAKPGYSVSLSTLDATLRCSTNGPGHFIWQYSYDGNVFVDVAPFNTLSSNDAGHIQAPVDLSKISDLQNANSKTIIFRLYAWGASTNSGTFSFGRSTTTTPNCLAIGGKVTYLPRLAQVTTLAPTDVTATSAIGNGNIYDIGNSVANHYGICWSTTATPTIYNNKTDINQPAANGTFLVFMPNLTKNTTYYTRAYIVNDQGISYGVQNTFNTPSSGDVKEYAITFTGSGAGTSVGSVLAENLTRGVSKTIAGSTTLYLNATGATPITTKLEDIQKSGSSKLVVYPNPAYHASTLSFNLPEAGLTVISVTDLSGKTIRSYSDNLEAGTYKFQLPAFQSGVYVVNVSAKGYKASEKLVSMSQSDKYSLIQNLGKIDLVESEKSAPQKVSAAISSVDGLVYYEGDQLRFTGINGRCKTILMDSPDRSKAIDFRFISCIDGNDNAYPVMKIGSQYWMTENLKTTKNTAGISLTKVATTSGWAALSSSSNAYSYLNDLDANAAVYGGLYTYSAAVASVPSGGWRLPGKADFYHLGNYFEGAEVAACKLKEKGTAHWTTDNVFATNESGFNALPGGLRGTTGFTATGKTSAYWTADATDASNAAIAKLESAKDSLSFYTDTLKTCGLSVRYVYDVPDDARVKMITGLFTLPNQGPTVNDLPLPQTTVLMGPDKELFFTGRSDTGVSPQFRLFDNPAATDAPLLSGLPVIAPGAVKWWQNPKKVTTRINANGKEDIVMAVWNETVQGPSYGTGKVTLHIIGDASTNFAHQSVVLPQDFTMPNIAIGTTAYNGLTMNACDIAEAWQWEMTVRTGDINGDCVPDILVAVHDILRVYDGKTFALISERNFSSDFDETAATMASKAFYLRAEIGDIDKNGKNDIVVSTSSAVAVTKIGNVRPPQLHVFLDGDLNPTDPTLHIKKTLGDMGTFITANIATGDINGDGQDEIAIEAGSLDGTYYSHYACYIKYNSLTKSFSNYIGLEGGDLQPTFYNKPMNSLIVANLKGGTSKYIIAGFMVSSVDANGNLSLLEVNSDIAGIKNSVFQSGLTNVSGNYDYVYGDQMVAGNFDKDPSGREMLYWIGVTIKAGTMTNYSALTNLVCTTINTTDSTYVSSVSAQPFFSLNSGNSMDKMHFPVIAAVNTKHTARVLEYQRHQFMLTKPVIVAVMAAAPFWTDNYDTNNSPTSNWGNSSTVSSTKEKEITSTASLSIGFEKEFTLPVVATKIGGVKFSAKVSVGFSNSFATEISTTTTQTFTAFQENTVVLKAVPYDSYFYKIVQSDNSAEIGSEVMLGFPRAALIQPVSVDTYNELTEGQSAPRIDKSLFHHTIGKPFTYPPFTTGFSNVPISDKLEYASSYIGAGSTGGSSQEVEMSKTSSKTTGFSQSYEGELELTVGGLSMGAGYGYEHGKNITTSFGTATTVSGYVPSIPTTHSAEAVPFQWALLWYNYTKGNQTFQVVNYSVK